MTGHDRTRRRLLGGLGAIGATAIAASLASIRPPTASPPPSTSTFAPVAPETAATMAPPPQTSPTIAPVAVPDPTTPTTVPARSFQVICRDAWGARPAGNAMVAHTLQRLTLHHTAARLDSSADAPARARSHQAFHQGEGFADLAYHFLVDASGNILEGRPIGYAGETFTEYDPAGHFLVCCEGNYDSQEPTDAQLESVADLFAWAGQTHSVDPSTLGGHRDYAATSCPGDRLYPLLSEGHLAAMVAERMTGAIERLDICGPEGAARITGIESGQA
ncbi:MAG: peptidoglycan recognition family protein [Acidimicrobiia bacterium]